MADDPSEGTDIIILVDESSSLNQNDVRAEIQAIQTLVNLPILAERGIRVQIIPFSSGPIRALEGCTTFVELGEDRSGAEQLTECAEGIVRQTSNSRKDTDFASAFTKAAQQFDLPPDQQAVLLLLTDGRYDSNGDGSVSSSEERALGAAIEKLRAIGVDLWALGFGRADLDDLEKYVREVSPTENACGQKPKAVNLGRSADEITEISIELTQLLAAAVCIDVVIETVFPSTYEAHPLVDRIGLSVTTEDSEPPVLRRRGVSNGDSEEFCVNAWEQKVSASDPNMFEYLCSVPVTTEEVGVWELDTSSGTGQVIWQAQGLVSVGFAACSVAEGVTLRFGRADGGIVDWGESGFKWPRAQILASAGTTGRERTITVEVDDQVQLDMQALRGLTLFKFGGISSIEPTDGSLGSSRLRFDDSARSTCDLERTSNSTVPSTDTTVPDGPPKPPGPPGPPVWPWILAFLVAATAVAVAVYGWRQRVFPAGTEIHQLSLSAGSSNVFLRLQDDDLVAGRRSFSLYRRSQDFVGIRLEDDPVDVKVTRRGEEIVFRLPLNPAEQQSDDEEPDLDHEVKTSGFGVPTQLNLGGVFFTVRVDKPEQDDFGADGDDD